VGLTSTLDTRAWGLAIRALAQQIPFAGSAALNSVAFGARPAAQAAARLNLRLRNDWTEKGFRVQKATKQALRATVYHLDDRMSRQEVGGRKAPAGPAEDFAANKGGRASLARPWRAKGRAFLAIHPEGTGLAKPLRRAQRPRALLQKARVFIATTSSGRTFIGQRLTGTEEGTRARRSTRTGRVLKARRRRLKRAFRVLFWLDATTATIRPRLGLRRSVTAYARQAWAQAMGQALAAAVKTSARPGTTAGRG
jgi:hypothetical protein